MTWKHIIRSGSGKAFLTAATSLLLLGLFLQGAVAQTTGEIRWEHIGPIGVSILDLVPHPTDPLTLYAVVDAHGIYKSTDGGETWQVKNQGIVGLTVLSLCIADETGQVLYAGTLGSGVVFKSGDGGETWEPAGGMAFESPVESSLAPIWGVLSLAAVNETVLYAGTGDAGIYKSEDGGESWIPINNGLTSGLGVHVYAILPDPKNEGVVYIGTTMGIFKSEDNGASWQQKFPSITTALAFADDGKTVNAGSVEGLVRSEDAGEHWEVMRQARRDGLLEVKALLVDGASLYVGTSGGLYETSDGRHWESGNGDLPLDGLVVRGIVKRGKWLYIGTGWGIFRSEDNGASWVQVSNGLPGNGLIVKRIAFGDGKENSMYIGTWGGGIYRSADRGTTWSEVNHGLGAPYITELKTSNGMLYAATWRAFYVSEDAEDTWGFFAEPIYSERFVVSPLLGSEIYALIQRWEEGSDNEWRIKGRLVQSGDSGSNWQAVESLTRFDVTDVIVDSENHQIMYVATRENGIYQSVDGGNQWNELDQESSIQGIHTLALGGEVGNVLFAGTPIGIYRKEQDEIWERTNLGSYDTIVTDPSYPNRVYAANSGGALIFSEDYGRTWKSAGFVDAGINDLTVDPDGDFIYVATEGQSVLRGNVNGLFPSSFSLTSLAIGLSGLVAMMLVVGFFGLSYSSGLPPGVLLRQKLALFQVGLGYRSYRQRWENSTPLEQLIVLLVPTEGPLSIKRLEQILAQMHVPVDVDQLEAGLNTAVRDGLLLRYMEKYHTVEPPLVRALQAHEGRDGQLALAEQIRRDHPLCANARRFLNGAGFVLSLVPEPLVYRCEPTSADLARLLPSVVYAQFLPGEELDDAQVLSIYDVVRQVDPDASVVFAITDRRPTDQGWAQIGILRLRKEPFTILPIESTLLNEGLATGHERTLLRTEVEKRLGVDYDPYDVRDPVAGAFSFFGRDVLVEDLLRRVAEGRPVGVFGLRKMGKSSLLQALRDRSLFPVAAVNLQTVGHAALDELYARILHYWAQWTRVRVGIELDLPTVILDDPTGSFVAATLALLEQLEQHQDDAWLGLFLDEAERIMPYPDGSGPDLHRYLTFLRAIRGLIDEDGRLSLVVASLNPSINRINAWNGEQNPSFNLLQEIYLSPLAHEDCTQMVRNIGRQVGLVYSNEGLDAIAALSGGHPFLARQLCSLLYKQRDRQPGQIEAAAIPAAVEHFIYDEQTVAHLDAGIWQDAGNPALWGATQAQVNHALLLELARAGGPVPQDGLLDSPDTDLRRTALINLERFHFIHQPDPGTYALRYGLLRTWLRCRKLGLE